MDTGINTPEPNGVNSTGGCTDAARRGFLAKVAGGVALGAMAALGGCEGEDSPIAGQDLYPNGNPSPTPSATAVLALTDTDWFVFMTQLLYLDAEYFSRAVLGVALPASLVTGAGTQGDVSTGPRPVTFTDALLGDMMREIAVEKIDQLVRLRAVLGAAAPARPALNLGVDAAGVFTRYGIEAAALPTVPLTTPVISDVYANQEQFLLGAFLIQDPLALAWRAATTVMADPANLALATGLFASSVSHSATVRFQLYSRSALRLATVYLSNLRDSYAPLDDDKGVVTALTGTGASTADINPADSQGELFQRLPNLTLNTYFRTRTTASSGGFFPSGINGKLRESAANNG